MSHKDALDKSSTVIQKLQWEIQELKSELSLNKMSCKEWGIAPFSAKQS